MSNSAFPQYPWLIDFTDITDVSIKAHGSAYLLANPDPSKNYYLATALALIDLANTKGVPVQMLNAVDPPHYLLVQWQVYYLCEQVCLNLIGTNDVEVGYDKYAVKRKVYHDELIQTQGKITFETFLTAAMQQNYTRAPGRTFDITY
jgi:hypothetical protein